DRKADYFRYGAPLYEASIQGDWNSAEAILCQKPKLVRYSLTDNGETALHVAASANKRKQMVEFVRNLVNKMKKEDLEFVNKNHNTALYLAAAAGNLETVKIMVELNRALLLIPGDGGAMPLYAAVLYGNYEIVKYLYKESKNLSDNGWTDIN
ncbi:ankyrin repeat-containing domain, PGG domain protein, partial [Tanacetum coccineum]